MLALLGTIFGLLGSIFPQILKLFVAKEDHKHEIAMANLQMEAQKQLATQRLVEINATADIEESKALYQSAEQKISGIKWIDGIVSLYNSSVRPTITYAFMALYMFTKVAFFYQLRTAGWTWMQVGASIWSSEDFAVFSTILAYWFGARMMKYSLERIPGK